MKENNNCITVQTLQETFLRWEAENTSTIKVFRQHMRYKSEKHITFKEFEAACSTLGGADWIPLSPENLAFIHEVLDPQDKGYILVRA